MALSAWLCSGNAANQTMLTGQPPPAELWAALGSSGEERWDSLEGSSLQFGESPTKPPLRCEGFVSMPDSTCVIWGPELCRCTLQIAEQEHFGGSKGHPGSATQPGQTRTFLCRQCCKLLQFALDVLQEYRQLLKGLKYEPFW